MHLVKKSIIAALFFALLQGGSALATTPREESDTKSGSRPRYVEIIRIHRKALNGQRYTSGPKKKSAAQLAEEVRLAQRKFTQTSVESLNQIKSQILALELKYPYLNQFLKEWTRGKEYAREAQVDIPKETPTGLDAIKYATNISDAVKFYHLANQYMADPYTQNKIALRIAEESYERMIRRIITTNDNRDVLVQTIELSDFAVVAAVDPDLITVGAVLYTEKSEMLNGRRPLILFGAGEKDAITKIEKAFEKADDSYKKTITKRAKNAIRMELKTPEKPKKIEKKTL